jgi:hypothetical protein
MRGDVNSDLKSFVSLMSVMVTQGVVLMAVNGKDVTPCTLLDLCASVSEEPLDVSTLTMKVVCLFEMCVSTC